jgi:Spy/CpxP family protein refolding chaperone
MWWKNPDIVQKLTLSADQQKRMDDIFQQSRLQLIDLKANVEKQEILLEPMLSDNPPDTNKVLAQIDHVASARAELEKANARMLLGIRGVLSADQWTKLQAERQEIHQRFGPGGPGFGPGGPGPAGGFRTRGGGPSAPISMMDAPSFPPGSTLILQQGFAGPDEGLLLAEVDDLDL